MPAAKGAAEALNVQPLRIVNPGAGHDLISESRARANDGQTNDAKKTTVVTTRVAKMHHNFSP
eukprot:3354080-Lingulodinium_polyedra.AAC.1